MLHFIDCEIVTAVPKYHNQTLLICWFFEGA